MSRHMRALKERSCGPCLNLPFPNVRIRVRDEGSISVDDS